MPDLTDPQSWIENAQENAQAAQDLQEAGRWPLGVCIHAQQAIEMALKAVLVANNIKHPFTHELERLYRTVPAQSTPNLDIDDPSLHEMLAKLSEYWFKRYPMENPPRQPTWDVAHSAFDPNPRTSGMGGI